MNRLPLIPLLLLAACGQAPHEPRQDAQQNRAAPVPAEVAPASSPKAEEADLVEFSYVWPKEAEAIPKLAAWLRRDRESQRAEAIETARADKAERPPEHSFNGHFFKKDWQTYGNGKRLLSLGVQTEVFTGGAHGNSDFQAILWDRGLNRQIRLADLFTNPAEAFARLEKTYCPALDRERATRRGETLPLKGEGWGVDCPKLSEQVVVPLDRDDGIFEALLVLIPPYEAGAYAEGPYELEIELTPELRRLIKPDYAAEFGPQPQ